MYQAKEEKMFPVGQKLEEAGIVLPWVLTGDWRGRETLVDRGLMEKWCLMEGVTSSQPRTEIHSSESSSLAY